MMNITAPDNIEIHLRDGKIVHSETGSYTILPPATIITVEKIFSLIGVERVELIDSAFTDGVPIFKLNDASSKPKCHRQACHWANPPTPLNNPPRETFGKGMTIQQSKASALMEAVERYCGQNFPHSSKIGASYNDIKEAVVNPADFRFPSLPPKCESCGDYSWDCLSDLTEAAQEWSWGYSLIGERTVLVPSAMVFYPYITGDDISFMFNDTGGLSAANTIEEAIVQGIAEIIERDALYYTTNLGNLKNMPRVNFNRTNNKHIQNYINNVLPHDSVFVYHIENKELGLGISSFAAFVCYQTEGGGRRYFGGSGTSLNPEIALLRALTEIEQQKVRQKALAVFERDSLIKHKAGQGNIVELEDLPKQSTGNIKGDVELYLDRMRKIGSDVIVVNLTHPDLGIPVVRVLIPKLIAYSGSDVKESHLLDAMRASGAAV